MVEMSRSEVERLHDSLCRWEEEFCRIRCDGLGKRNGEGGMGLREVE